MDPKPVTWLDHEGGPSGEVLAVAEVRVGERLLPPVPVDRLSPRGALLSALPMDLPLGSTVALTLRLPGLGPLTTLATIIGIESDAELGSRCLALFQHGPSGAGLIQAALTEHLERVATTPRPVVLVLAGPGLVASSLCEEVRALGREPVFFESLAGAEEWLRRSNQLFGSVLVDAALVARDGPTLLHRVLERFPHRRRVVVGDAAQLAALPAERLWTLHGVLERPWTQGALESAVGLHAPAHEAPRRRILFVDDEAYVLAGLQDRLRRDLKDCEAVWVTSADEALDEQRACPFDVVVADLRMPGMDGVALLTEIKRRAPQTRCVLLSGFPTEAAERVADWVLHKPCPPEVLSDILLRPD